jgi:cytochrome c-type biogenesis protein CcmH/NrfF
MTIGVVYLLFVVPIVALSLGALAVVTTRRSAERVRAVERRRVAN